MSYYGFRDKTHPPSLSLFLFFSLKFNLFYFLVGGGYKDRGQIHKDGEMSGFEMNDVKDIKNK